MKLWHALVGLAMILVASFVGFVEHKAQESLPQIESQPMLLGLRGDAHYDEAWDKEHVRATLEDAGFEVLFEDDWNVHATRGGNGTIVKVLPMGEGILFHVFYELEEPVPHEADAADGRAAELEREFRDAVAAFEAASGWTHASLNAEPLTTDA